MGKNCGHFMHAIRLELNELGIDSLSGTRRSPATGCNCVHSSVPEHCMLTGFNPPGFIVDCSQGRLGLSVTRREAGFDRFWVKLDKMRCISAPSDGKLLKSWDGCLCLFRSNP